jgi:hypothetical protein
LSDVAFGSFPTELSYLHHVRFAPDSDHRADVPVSSFVLFAENQRAPKLDAIIRPFLLWSFLNEQHRTFPVG